MNSTKTFQADVFVIPNRFGALDAAFDGTFESLNSKLGRFGIEGFKTMDEKVLQIWIASPEEDNWNSHGTPDEVTEALGMVDECGKRPNYLSEYFPARYFEGKSEGDVVTITMKNGVNVELTLAQTKYRYRSFGRFEEVFARMTV